MVSIVTAAGGAISITGLMLCKKCPFPFSHLHQVSVMLQDAARGLPCVLVTLPRVHSENKEINQILAEKNK